MTRNLLILGLIVVIVLGFVLAYVFLTPEDARGPMGMGGRDVPTLPAVLGYAAGEEIHFVHPEASGSEVAELLTEMMDSPVLVVPALADVPDELVADVYVFANGIEGEGPTGFQPDVFDRPPGDPGYSPLRAVNLVTWTDEQAAQVLTSADDVMEAEAAGELTIERTGAVVNMPMLTWPGGRR